MALKETASCVGGHTQTYVRADRPGRCTSCGGPLVRSVFDDALPMGKTTKSEGARDAHFVEDEEPSPTA